MRIGIVGAGMAGLACAQAVSLQDHDVLLFDKGRGPGGRMSTRRLPTSAGDASFDHGAQYFTVRDPAFRQQVEIWQQEGVVAPWRSAGPEAYVGVPAMNAPLRHMAGTHSVQWATQVLRIEGSERNWRLVLDQGASVHVDLVVVATPAEQAAALLASIAPDLAAHARAVESAPCWTLMLAFADAVDVRDDCWRGTDIIGWAARNNSKPQRVGPEAWVVQGTPAWSRDHLEADAQWVASRLKSALSDLLGVSLPAVLAQSSHRWRFALSGAQGSRSIFDRDRGIGLCGDWLIGPRVESAWLSGAALAAHIAPRTGA